MTYAGNFVILSGAEHEVRSAVEGRATDPDELHLMAKFFFEYLEARSRSTLMSEAWPVGSVLLSQRFSA